VSTEENTIAMELDPDLLRADFPILDQTIHRQRPLIYLDNAASTQRPRQVIQAMNDNLEKTYANVHRGTHWLSEESSRLYEEARLTAQKFIGAAWSDEVIFTPGTTLGINTVARSWGDANVKEGDEILLTIMEHHSNIVPWQQLAERSGAVVRFCGITPEGLLDRDDFRSRLSPKTKVVGIVAVSNTLGTINPVAELVKEVRSQCPHAVVVVDAAQHVPHEPTDVVHWDADFAVFSGHKLTGPSGIGVLYGKRDHLQDMQPFLGGGSMIKTVTTEGFTPGDLPARFEAGTPPITQAIGLAAAIEYVREIGLQRIGHYERQLAEVAQSRLSEIEGLKILGPGADKTCGIVSFVVQGVSAQDLSVLLDLQGIAIRAGHHCTMPLHQHLNVSASCRASFYFYNTIDEVNRLADVLQEVLPKLR